MNHKAVGCCLKVFKMQGSLLDRYVLAWRPMLLLTILNGALRDTWYGRSLSELRAHQISTLTGAVLWGIYLGVVARLWEFSRLGRPSWSD